MLYLVSYDIPADRRRLRVAKHLEDYGKRVQYSVFELELSPEMFGQVMRRLVSLLKLDEDNVRAYSLCATCAGNVDRVGTAVKYAQNEYYVF